MRPQIPHCGRTGDYSCESPRVRFADGGRLLQLRFAPSPASSWDREHFYNRDPEKVRGICRGFSFSSRRRMLNHLNSISVGADLPSFVTLTFPDECFNDSVTQFSAWAKDKMDAYMKRLGRVCKSACGFWRLEWQARKSGVHEGKLFPHFHLMVWGLPLRDVANSEDPATGVPRQEPFVHFQDDLLTLDHFNTTAMACAVMEGVGDSSIRAKLKEFEGTPMVDGECEFIQYSGDECWGGRTTTKKRRRFDKAWTHKMLCEEGIRDGKQMSFFDWTSLAWYHVVGSLDTNHFLAGVRVEQVRTWGGVLAYCSKYMAKMGDNNFLQDIPLGRSWGVFNRVFIPWAKMVELELPQDVGIRLRRIARHYLERQRGRKFSTPYGVTLYCDVSRWKSLFARPPDPPPY